MTEQGLGSAGSFDMAIRDAARRSTVRIISGTSRGSGFFARQGVVLTCAHIVGERDTATVVWEDREYSGKVRPHPNETEYDDPELWPFPDVAVIRLTDAPPDHPVPYFGDSTPLEGDRLLAYGFTDGDLEPGPQSDGVLVTTAGAAGNYLRVKDDQIVEGMSGSLAISTTTGLVMGMIKASRSTDAPQGGWICPSNVLSELLDQAVGEDNRAETALPGDIWTDALLTPVRALLRGQIELAASPPYRLMDPPLPRLGDIYVKQQASGGQGPVEVAQMLAEHRHALVIGQPGSGKTSLLQNICTLSAQWWLDRVGPQPFGPVIPVRVAASSFSSRRAFLDSLASSVQRDLGPFLDTPVTAGLFARPPLPGVSWLIMIDGLDEVISSDQRLAILQAIEQRINDVEQPQRILLATRPLLSHEFGIARSVPRFELMMFDPRQTKDFARNWFTTRHTVMGATSIEEAERIAEHFVKQLERAEIKSISQVPLLLTIAAIVFEKSPSRELPPTITTLYAQLVDFLSSRQGPLPQDSEIIPADAAWVWEKRVALMENIADQWFFGAGQSIFQVALGLVTGSKTHPTRDTTQLRNYLRSVLTHSGVVVVTANELEWIHLSVAEYLASRILARKAAPEKWFWLADQPTTANIARLALVQLARANGLTLPFIEKLADQKSANLILRELLGTPGLLSDEMVAQLARSAERRGKLESAPYGAYWPAAAVLRAALSKGSIPRRQRSAKALIRDGSLSDARTAMAAVTKAASSPWRLRGRLSALEQLVVSVQQRPDAAELDNDVHHLQRRGRTIVGAWWRTSNSRTRQAIKLTHALPPKDRASILAESLHGRRISKRTKVDAAYTIASDFDDPSGVELLREEQDRHTRFQFNDVYSHDATIRHAYESAIREARTVTLRETYHVSGRETSEATLRELLNFASSKISLSARELYNSYAMDALASSRDAYASEGDLSSFHPISALTPFAIAFFVALLTISLSSGHAKTFGITAPLSLGVIVALLLYLCHRCRIWWKRPTTSALNARTRLRLLANNGSPEIRAAAAAAVSVQRRDLAASSPLSLSDWVSRKHVRRRARTLAMSAMSKDGQVSGIALGDLRQALIENNRFDRRAMSTEIYETAYNNPRSARALLHLLRTEGDLGKRQRERIAGLLDVLDGDADF
jgi:hypothetical protein